MWSALDLVRVYTKPQGRMPDYSAPVVLKRSKCTVENFCASLPRGGALSAADMPLILLSHPACR